MPIDLARLAPRQILPTDRPSKLVWAVASLLIALGAMIFALALWPKDMPTKTLWFWVCIVIFPTSLPSFIVLRRFSIYESRVLETHAWNSVCEQYEAKVFERASEPVAVLASAHCFSADETENSLVRVAEGALGLGSQASIALPGSIRARWLAPASVNLFKGPQEADATRQAEVLGWIFKKLIAGLADSTATLPRNNGLLIQLSVSPIQKDLDIEDLWCRAWRAHVLPDAVTLVHVEAITPMILDEWLDEPDSNEDSAARLIVAVQMHNVLSDNPPSGSAEVGIALLLARKKAVVHGGLHPVALLHRPVCASDATFASGLSSALRFARALATDIHSLWQTGFDGGASTRLLCSVKDFGIHLPSDPQGQHDIDQTVGFGGAAAGWLALICAAEAARTSEAPQLVAQGAGLDHVVAVVVPAGLSRQADRGRAI